MRQVGIILLVVFSMFSLAPGQARAVVAWDEDVDGDLSGDGLAPSSAVLVLGSNTVTATSVSGDREYLRVTVPAGQALSQLVLNSFSGQDGTAFIAVQSGATFTESHIGTDVSNLLGYSHFGPAEGPVPFDYLPILGVSFGSIGFTAPLPSGDYTFWMQQTGVNATTYQWDLVTIPEPATLGLLLIGGAAVWRRR